MKVCVVVPMYNEEALARESIETILSYTQELPPVVTLLVVNDGSRDGTAEILQSIASRYPPAALTILSHAANQGYGAALKTGIRFADERKYDYVLFMDSDLTNHPKFLKDFHDKMAEGWDYIKATRYIQGSAVVGVPWQHRLISTVGNAVARCLYALPLTDITNGFRAVKVDILSKLVLRENDFTIIVEELCQAKRLTQSFTEIPYVLTSRHQGVSRFAYTLKTCLRYFRYAMKSRI